MHRLGVEIRKVALISALVFLSSALPMVVGSCSSPRLRESVQLPIGWSPGDRIQIQLVKRRDAVRPGRPELHARSTTPIDIEVVEKLDDGFLIRWTQGRTLIDPANPITERMANLGEGVSLEFRTDEFGFPIEIINAEQLASKLREVGDFIAELLGTEGLPEEMVAAVLRGVEPMYQPETMSALMLKDPTIFFLACGGTYPLQQKIEYEDQLPNPFGGPPFPSKAFFRLTSVDRKLGRAHLEWRQEIDPDRATGILTQTMRAMGERMGTPPPDDEKLPRFEITDEATYEIDLQTGWPVSMTNQRVITSDQSRRVESWEFTLLTPSKN